MKNKDVGEYRFVEAKEVVRDGDKYRCPKCLRVLGTRVPISVRVARLVPIVAPPMIGCIYCKTVKDRVASN